MPETLMASRGSFPSTARALIVALVLLASLLFIYASPRQEVVPLHQPLASLPMTFGGWQGTDYSIPQRIVAAAGVSTYLNRTYVNDRRKGLALYVGYYDSQRTGDTIHSPKNCLPGAGWEATQSGTDRIAIPGYGPIVVNRYIVQKGLNRDLVLYWYQGRGRVIASEYWGKVYMVWDALRRNRTDGALVRVVCPILNDPAASQRRAETFIREVFPKLNQIIPN